MSKTLDVIHSGHTQAKVKSITDRVPLTALTSETDVQIVFVLSTRGDLKVEEEVLSYKGLDLLSNRENYETVDVNQMSGIKKCSYCGKDAEHFEYYSVVNKAVFSGHSDCLDDFVSEVQDLKESARKYAVSSEI